MKKITLLFLLSIFLFGCTEYQPIEENLSAYNPVEDIKTLLDNQIPTEYGVHFLSSSGYRNIREQVLRYEVRNEDISSFSSFTSLNGMLPELYECYQLFTLNEEDCTCKYTRDISGNLDWEETVEACKEDHKVDLEDVWTITKLRESLKIDIENWVELTKEGDCFNAIYGDNTHRLCFKEGVVDFYSENSYRGQYENKKEFKVVKMPILHLEKKFS